MEYQQTIIEGKIVDVPILETIHLTVFDRLKRYGYLKDMPKQFKQEEINKAINDLVAIGWISTTV
jgi:hypothetical protein